MGLAVTASHLIIVVALLVAGSTLGASVLRSTQDVNAHERAAARALADVAHTRMDVVVDATFPLYDAVAETYEVKLKNSGSTVLKVSRLTFLIDGAHADGLLDGAPTVDGDAATDLWMSGQELHVRFTGVAEEPERFAAFAENGAAVYHRT